MNRKTRRDIMFGRAFSVNREMYHASPYLNPPVGIDGELFQAYLEEYRNTRGWTEDQFTMWLDSEIYPYRS